MNPLRILVFLLLLASPLYAAPTVQTYDQLVTETSSDETSKSRREALGSPETSVTTYEQLLSSIRDVQKASQERIEAAVKAEKLREAWETGKLINEHILQNEERAEYGAQVMDKLAKDLGTSRTELNYMRVFANAYPIYPLTGKLPWSSFRELLSVNNPIERDQLRLEASKNGWSQTRIRQEIKALQAEIKQEELEALPEAKPGKVGVYRVVLGVKGPHAGHLVLDLGFNNFFRMGNMEQFKDGDLVYVKPIKQSEKGLAVRYQFEQVITDHKPEDLHVALKKNPIYGDASMLYTYEAYVLDVIDGDTFRAVIDLGFGFTTVQRVRLLRVDAPELISSEGKEAKALLEKILMKDGGKVLIQSKELDQHGRPLANVFVEEKSIDPDLLVSETFTRSNE